jgi:hypothetical protein
MTEIERLWSRAAQRVATGRKRDRAENGSDAEKPLQ